MKIIFVSGKYTSNSYSEIEENIRKAEKVSIQLLKKGWGVFTPHKNTAHYEIYDFDYNLWIKMDLEILKRCDAIFMMKGWSLSKGSKIEHQFALENNINIYYELDGFPNL